MYILTEHSEIYEDDQYLGATPIAVSDTITKLINHVPNLTWNEPDYDEDDLDSFCITTDESSDIFKYSELRKQQIRYWHSIENVPLI